MTVTMAYLNKLREAGVYDNSVIIILSDHGYNIEGEAVKVAQKNENETGRQHPILFVKGLNEVMIYKYPEHRSRMRIW